MYSQFADPDLATRIAKQHIDEWVRDAESRRTARDVRRAARAHRTADNDSRRAARTGSASTRTLASDGT